LQGQRWDNQSELRLARDEFTGVERTKPGERDIVGGRIQSGLAASLAERQALEREGEGMPFWHGVRLITFFIPEACVPRMIQAEHPSLRASEAA